MPHFFTATALMMILVSDGQILGLTFKSPVYAQAPSIAQQENAANDWKKNATPQEKQQASTMHQQAHNDAAQDRANPSASREASQEHAAGKEAHNDVKEDRGSHGHGRK